jgi:hypothetical protein
MVQGIDNLTRISGRIVSREPHPTLPDFDLLNIVVESTKPVEGRADLLSEKMGQEIGFAVRRELLADANPGDQLTCRAKRIPEGAMCEPYPDPGDFEVNRR